MGGLVERLTKTGLDYGPGQQTYFDSAPAAGMSLARQAAASAEPATATIGDNLPEPSVVPGREMLPGPAEGSLPTADYVPGESPKVGMRQPGAGVLPRLVKPSFSEASTDASGMPAKSAPGLTRLGKLFQILGLAGQGAAAGQAAMEANIARSGGHYAGGFGTGFQAGLTEPARQAEIKQGAERGALQNEALKQNIAAYPWLRAMQMRREQASIKADEALAKYREWQMQNEKATEDEKIGAKLKIAQEAGFDPEETKQFVYGIAPKADKTVTPHTTEVGNKVMQFNPATGRYDITVGPAPVGKDRSNKPTTEEFKLNLYKTDPETYQAIYGGSKDETQIRRNLLQYGNELTARLKNGEYDTEEERQQLRETLRGIDKELGNLYGQKTPKSAAVPVTMNQKRGGSTGTELAPPVPELTPSTATSLEPKPQKGARRTLTLNGKKHSYVFNGQEYVLATQ